jgi:hypothetical protein
MVRAAETNDSEVQGTEKDRNPEPVEPHINDGQGEEDTYHKRM